MRSLGKIRIVLVRSFVNSPKLRIRAEVARASSRTLTREIATRKHLDPSRANFIL